MYEGTYLSKIPQKELVQQIERYRDACPFRVAVVIQSYMATLRITTDDGLVLGLRFYYSGNSYESVRDLLAIDAGPEGVYVWSVLDYHRNFHRWIQPTTGRGKWIDVRASPYNEPIAILPWCYELKEALNQILERIRSAVPQGYL